MVLLTTKPFHNNLSNLASIYPISKQQYRLYIYTPARVELSETETSCYYNYMSCTFFKVGELPLRARFRGFFLPPCSELGWVEVAKERNPIVNGQLGLR